jgi:hypothetical protein
MTARCPSCGQYRRWYGCREHGALFAAGRAWRRWQRNRRIEREIARLFPVGGWRFNGKDQAR